MNRAGNVVHDYSGASTSEVSANDLWAQDDFSYRHTQSRWVAALFVQFRFMHTERCREHDEILGQYRSLLERAVCQRHGDVVALSQDAGLAVFSGALRAEQHTHEAIDAATSLIQSAQGLNKQRLAQDLSPLRLGIGIDGGMLAASTCNRPPLLDPSLQGFLSKARRLSELNYQTPFPAIFVSPPVADRLHADGRYAIQNLGSTVVDKEIDPLTVYAVLTS